MNFRIEQALLIVDPKGFLFDQIAIPLGKVPSPEQEYSSVCKILRSNWTLYTSKNIVDLDWALSKLRQYLMNQINSYNRLANKSIQLGIEGQERVEKELIDILQLLQQTVKRIFFYQIHINAERYFSGFSITSLYLTCDNFKILKIVSDIEVKILQQQSFGGMTKEEDRLTRGVVAKVLASPLPFTQSICALFDSLLSEQLNYQLRFMTRQKGEVLLDIREIISQNNGLWSEHIVKKLGLQLSRQEEIRLTMYLKVMKSVGDYEQLSYYVQLSKNMYLTLQESSKIHQQHWLSLYRWTQQIILMRQNPIVSLNQTLKYCPKESYIQQIIESHNLKEENTLLTLSYALKNSYDGKSKQWIYQEMSKSIECLLKEEKWKQSEEIFECIQYCSSELKDRVFERYYRLMMQEVAQSSVDVFIFEQTFIHFFKLYLSPESTQYYQRIIHPQFLTLILNNLNKLAPDEPNLNTIRVNHFVFNQVFYFSQSIMGFDQYIWKLILDQQNRDTLVQIYSKFLKTNKCLFKLNFKLIHRLIDHIYSQGQENDIENIEVCSLYWETNAKFLLFWGFRSYLEDQLYGKENYLENILFKLLEILPQLTQTHENQQKLFKHYLDHKEQYSSQKLPYWLNLLAYKNRSLAHNLLYSCLFLRDSLTGYQFKSILELIIKLYTPFVNVTSDSLIEAQFSFLEEIEIVCSEFALQILQTISTFKITKDLDLDWVSNYNAGVFRAFWKSDRSSFLNLLVTIPLSPSNYQSLVELRRLEFNLLLFNSVMQKLNTNAIKEIQEVKSIQSYMVQVIEKVEYKLAPILWQECLQDFYSKSLKLRNETDKTQLNRLRSSLERQILTKNNSSLGFQRLQITDKYLLFKYFKMFFQSYKMDSSHKKVMERSVRRVIEFVHTNPDVEYTTLATQLELVYVVEKYCSYSSQNQKKLKFSLLSPIVQEQLIYILQKLDLLTELVQNNTLSLISEKLCYLLVRQLNKYYIAYLLHDCISFHHHYSPAHFTRMLNTHMRLQKSILTFIKNITNGCEQSHNVYLEVLDSNISLFMTVLESNQNEEIKEPLMAYGKQLGEFILSIIKLMFSSTFALKSRCRSSIIHILINKYEALTKTPKSIFNKPLGIYLKSIFDQFLPFQFNPKINHLLFSDTQSESVIDIQPITHLSKIELACTQAMIINLIGRNNYSDMCVGISQMFQGQSLISYINYLLIITDELSKLQVIKESNLETLTVDVFGALENILTTNIDHQQVIPLLIRILDQISTIAIDLKLVKNNIIKYIIKQILLKPSPESFGLLKGIQKYGYEALLPRVIQLESELLQFKSPLHILNVMYYDKHNFKNVRMNWPLILENHSEQYVHQFIEETRREDNNRVFVYDYRRYSQRLNGLIGEFVKSCLQYINNLNTINECYLLFQSILAVGIKFPSLIDQIYQYSLNIEQLKTKYGKCPESWRTIHSQASQINFVSFMLDLVEINPRFTVQFVHFALKTNSGFRVTEESMLVSSNLFILKTLESLLLARLTHLYSLQYSQNKLVSIFGILKSLEHTIRQGPQGLFKLYNISSPPRQSLTQYYNQLSKSFLVQIYTFVIDHFSQSKNPLIEQTMIHLLGYTLKKSLEKNEIDLEVEDNIKYYLNNYVYSILQGYQQYEWALNKEEKVSIKFNNYAIESYVSKQKSQQYQNSFLNIQYNIFREDEYELFQAENETLTSKLQILGLGDSVSRLESSFKQINSMGDRRLQFTDINHSFPIYDQTKKHKGIHVGQLQSHSTSHIHQSSQLSYQNSGDYILDHDQFLEDDGIIDETEDTKEKLSSFEELISGVSDNAVKQLVRRVNKLEIMEDLEQGKQVSQKLQFLSNDQLLKLSSLAQGKLLLEIEHEKQFRGFAPTQSKYGNVEYEQPIQYRYLDELYPGCRKVNIIHELIEQKRSLIPSLPQPCLLKIFQMFIQSFGDDDLHKRMLKTIHLLCLNPGNLLFFGNTLYFTLSVRECQLIHMKDWFGWLSLDTLKSHSFQLMSYLFQNKIGLVLWILGQINLKTLSLNNIKPPAFLESIAKKLDRQETSVRIIELACLNINLRRPENNLQRLLEVYNQYLEEKEGKYNIDYPWFDTPELALSSNTAIEELVIEILKKRKRVQEGGVLQLLFKLLLKIYPGCYETIMLHFFHEASIQVKKIVDNQSSNYKKFLTLNMLNPGIFQDVNKNQETLIKMVESYSTFILDKNTHDNLLKQTSIYLKDSFNDVYLGILPWFKEWRFRVENREELGKHYEEVRELKDKINGVKIIKNYSELEKLENQLKKLDHRLRDWKSEHKNQFLRSYIKPIHECFSVNLLSSFKKSVDLLEETTQLFRPTQQNFKIVEPVYRNQSVVWQMILAFMSVYLQESTNSYHTMSKLATRQFLRDEQEHKKRRSRKSRKSIRMSVAHSVDGGLANISLMLRLGQKITLVAYYLKEGSQLIKALAQYGSLDIKLKSIKRRKSGIVKEIEIDRNKIWFDSIINIDEDFVQKDIRIKFKGQIGIDYGGLTKQWLTSITQQLFNPNFGLFELSANKLTIQPSRFSYLVPQHLMHFRKLGLLVGKSLIQDWTLEINFTKSFLKHLLGNTIYVQDLFDIDPDTAKSLVWILDNEVNEDLEIDFCIQEDALGKRVRIPLIENGEEVMVNESNKKEYVKAVCRYKMTEQIRPQAKAFMDGLEEVVPYDILKCMNHKQLGLYLAGMPKINVQQMQKYAKYNNYNESEQAVKWLWEVLAEFDEQQLANFLFFVSGSFKVPYGGFKEYPLVINRGFVVEHLPVAHTCFNTLDLPPYTTKHDLRKKLKIAISEGKGFGVS